MKWIGKSGNKFAVGKSRSVYMVRQDGTLEVRGNDWKECPLDMGLGYCRRSVREMNDKDCKGCTRHPVRGRLDSQKQAILVAEELESLLSPK